MDISLLGGKGRVKVTVTSALDLSLFFFSRNLGVEGYVDVAGDCRGEEAGRDLCGCDLRAGRLHRRRGAGRHHHLPAATTSTITAEVGAAGSHV